MHQRKAAVIGATGVAGQQFLVPLATHPFFKLTALAASARSAGKRYERAITAENGAGQVDELRAGRIRSCPFCISRG